MDPEGLVFETPSDYITWQLSFYYFTTAPGLLTGASLAYDSVALGLPFLPGGGGYAQGASKICLLTAPKMAKHHIFPQRFKPFFNSKGIDIDKFTVSIPQNTAHLKGVHGNGLNNMPGKWNERWENFIKSNPNATPQDIYQFGGKLMDEYGLSGLPIQSYK
ncbi:MAG: DUF2380 domain-containing protein [Candidatus Omnitrophica bacterium]|nr:DUF2380 domain-containing protein [Candidatus Omnitrophota bacterium]